MLVQEERGPRAKVVVSRRYCALDEKAVACVATGSSADMIEVTSLFVSVTEESRSKLSCGNPKILQLKMVESSVFCGRIHFRWE